jgi:cyclopropane fatty-acyl-phospholipid synthase-like methyltransferase
MDGTPVRTRELPATERRRLANIADYYDRATLDYRYWNSGLHMHFGCWRWPLSPFDRAAMVEQLSADVIARLSLERAGTVVDLGCGVGSTARLLATENPRVRVIGLSLSASQVELGNRLSADEDLHERIELRVGDYRSTTLASASAIGAYAIESSCYDPEHGAGLIREARRVLEPGGRLIIADAFRRRARLPPAARALERRMSEGWSLPGMPDVTRFTECLVEHGFDVKIEDISWRVAPCILQIPLVTLGFRLREGFRLDPHRTANARAPLWCLLSVLLFPRCFGYYLITATRP